MPNNDNRELNNLVNQFEYTASIVSSKTPVLFSTNHGIHLRTNVTNNHGSSKYKLNFCDLERWQCNVNKVNSIGLTSLVDGMKCESDKRAVKHKAKGVKFVSESAGSSSTSNVSKWIGNWTVSWSILGLF